MTASTASRYSTGMDQFTKFTNKARDFYHISDGWCVRQLERPDVWRMFYGHLRSGTRFPDYVTVHKQEGEPVDFPEFMDAVQWVEKRRGS